MQGTTRLREPSLRWTSTAIPRLTWPVSTTWGLPSTSAYLRAITGHSPVASTIAQAIRARERDSCRALERPVDRPRLASSVSTASVRNEVAVGMDRLSFIALASIAAALQRLGLALRGRRGGGSRAVAVGGREHVLLGHLAAGTRALDSGEVDPFAAATRRATGDARPLPESAGAGSSAAGVAASAGGAPPRSRRARPKSSRPGPGRPEPSRRARPAARDGAACRGRHLRVDLVGGDLDHRLAFGYPSPSPTRYLRTVPRSPTRPSRASRLPPRSPLACVRGGRSAEGCVSSGRRPGRPCRRGMLVVWRVARSRRAGANRRRQPRRRGPHALPPPITRPSDSSAARVGRCAVVGSGAVRVDLGERLSGPRPCRRAEPGSS